MQLEPETTQQIQSPGRSCKFPWRSPYFSSLPVIEETELHSIKTEPPAPTPDPSFSIKQILGANTRDDQILLYVQLDNLGYAWIPSHLIAEKEPQTLIKFYESKLKLN